MKSEGREKLIQSYGEEVILRCCRDWKCHYNLAVYSSGRCGLCRQHPQIVESKTWEN